MIIGVMEAKFSLPEAHSLKDKRMVVRSLKDRVTGRFNISAAEVGHQDFWKSAHFAFVTVASERKIVDRRLAELLTFLRSEPRLVLLDVSTTCL